MRPHTIAFRLSAGVAAASLLLGQLVPRTALAQMLPPSNVAAGGAQEQFAGDPPERVGRVAQVNGTVSFRTQDANQWSPATANYPVASGGAFWAGPDGSAQLQISGSRVALGSGTELDVATLDQNGLQAIVPQGEAYLQLRNLAPNEAWSVQTPRGLVTFAGPGRYAVAAGDTQTPTSVTVLDGAAQISGPGVSMQVGPGQTATITGTDTFQGRVGPAQTDAFIGAMQQAERPPPTPAVAPPPMVAQMPGGDDLAAYGSWSQAPDYGAVWYPQVEQSWEPYREGHWAYVPPWGWTWVDDAPWGFAPSHYGRWVQIGGRWAWAPGTEDMDGRPVYAPALVTFFGIGAGVGIGAALAAGSIGWFALGPREPYRPWYRSSDRYLRDVNRHHFQDFNAFNRNPGNRNPGFNSFANRGHSIVVPTSAMAGSRPVRQFAQRVDSRTLAEARPFFGNQPVRPTAATAGVTPGVARRGASGPAIRQFAPAQNAAAGRPFQPPLHNPAQVQGVAPAPGGARPFNAPGGSSVARPQPALVPGATPALRTPGAREGGAPQFRHDAPGGGFAQPGGPQAGFARPAPGASPERHPGVAPQAPFASPQLQVHTPTPAPQFRAPPASQQQVPTPAQQFRAAPPPQAQQFRAAPPAQVQQFHAPPPQAPQFHAPPPQVQQFHAPPPQVQQFHAPPPQVQQFHAPAPAPAPQFHAAPPPAAHPAPPPAERKKPFGEH